MDLIQMLPTPGPDMIQTSLRMVSLNILRDSPNIQKTVGPIPPQDLEQLVKEVRIFLITSGVDV